MRIYTGTVALPILRVVVIVVLLPALLLILEFLFPLGSSDSLESVGRGTALVQAESLQEVTRHGTPRLSLGGAESRIPSGSVGVLVLSHTGQPVAGAPVALVTSFEDPPHSTSLCVSVVLQTDLTGFASIPASDLLARYDVGDLMVEVLGVFSSPAKVALLPQESWDSSLHLISVPSFGSIEFVLEGSSICWSDHPLIEEATVWLATDVDPGRMTYATTQKRRKRFVDARCRFDYVETGTRLLARLSRSGTLYPPFASAVPRVQDECASQSVHFPGIALSGLIVADDGSSLAGLSASLAKPGGRYSKGLPVARLRIGEGGNPLMLAYSLRLEEGNLDSLAVTAVDQERGRLWRSVVPIRCSVSSDRVLDIGTVALSSANLFCSGRVVDGTGAPIEGAIIQVEESLDAGAQVWRTHRGAWERSVALSDTEGKFAVYAAAEKSGLRLSVGYCSQKFLFDDVTAGEERVFTVPVSAIVRLSIACEEVPVELFSVQALDEGGGVIAEANPGVNGDVVLGLDRPGAFRVRAKAPNRELFIPIGEVQCIPGSETFLGAQDLRKSLVVGYIEVQGEGGSCPELCKAFDASTGELVGFAPRGIPMLILSDVSPLRIRVSGGLGFSERELVFQGGRSVVVLPRAE